MNILIVLAVILFCGIGLVFEVVSFVFRLIFSGASVFIGLTAAILAAVFLFPLIAGLFGIIIPRLLLVVGIVALFAVISNRIHRENREEW